MSLFIRLNKNATEHEKHHIKEIKKISTFKITTWIYEYLVFFCEKIVRSKARLIFFLFVFIEMIFRFLTNNKQNTHTTHKQTVVNFSRAVLIIYKYSVKNSQYSILLSLGHIKGPYLLSQLNCGYVGTGQQFALILTLLD